MFPSYPQFVPLNIELKDEYGKLVASLPPYSDISFATLQIWWNLSEQLSISLLNDNVVINYHLSFDPDNSGLSLIGKRKVDESINTIFNHLRGEHKNVQLIHVPEFVIEQIEQREIYSITEEQDYNEYLLDSADLAKLEGSDYQEIRKKIRRFQRSVADKKLEIRPLELSLQNVQDELLESIAEWESKNNKNNDPSKSEHAALRKTLKHASSLDIKNLSVFIDDKLHGIIIYDQPLGKEYYNSHHLKANYEIPYISYFLQHEIAKHAVTNKVSTINIEMDLGIENLREHKLSFRPAGYFRKYTVRPA